jgi:hypothetical protein
MLSIDHNSGLSTTALALSPRRATPVRISRVLHKPLSQQLLIVTIAIRNGLQPPENKGPR